jgi:molybdopterin molybdotransferase
VRTGITPGQALELVLEHTPVLGAEMLGVAACAGRVLAEAVVASRALPPHDNSAMDGYAVRAADLVDAATAPVSLRVAFEIAAGAPPARSLSAGEAARILTGAPLPGGADAVVRQEDTERDGQQLRVRVAPQPGDHVRAAGKDVRAGQRVMQPGVCLNPGHVGLLTSLGRSFVSVRQRPRVAILSGGDELVEPDGDVSGGRIVSSNAYALAAQCREVGAEPVSLGIARDAPDDIEQRLRAGLASDVLISSAGVSVGDRDYVRGVLDKLGCRLVFWGVAMKPGYPMAFGLFGDAADGRGPLVFGLPGNPVSAMVTFEQFVRPALLRMMGHTALYRPTLRARVAETLHKRPGRMHFVRVRLVRDGDEVVAQPTGAQGSGLLCSMAQAQGLLLFPADQTQLCAGESATVQLLDTSFLAAAEVGF